jgi:hypothetical protein
MRQMSVEEAAQALLAGVERACPAREAARLRKAGGPRPDVASDWTALRPSRLPPATPGAFEAAVGGFARETRAAVAAAAARAVAQAGAPSDDALFSCDDDGDAAPFDDEDADEGAWAAEGADEDDGAPAETPRRATPGSGAKAALAASRSPRKRSPRGGGGSAFARRRRVRLTLGITPETAAPVLRRKRIFGDATPAERDTTHAHDDDGKVRPFLQTITAFESRGLESDAF